MVQTKRKTNVIALAIVLSLVFVFALSAVLFATPATVSAYVEAPVSYMGWDEESGELVERETDSTPTAVTSSMTELSAGWYIVDDDVTIESTVNVNSGGVINLILVDGKTLTINAPYGNNPLRLNNSNTTLNIYGQAAGTGELHIESNYGCAIFASGSYVNVYGGKVYAKAQENCNGSYGIMCKTLTVYGGQVTALGYDWKDYKGIGIVGNLVMYGGEVIAKAGSEKAIYGTITAGEDIDWVIFNSTDNGSSWSTISLDEDNKCSDSDYHVKVMVRAKMVGSGYSNNPYKISTADQLNRFRDIVNGLNDEEQNKFAWAVLMNDIDLDGSESNQWTPIGTSSNKYGGTFDGKGYTIRGLYINSDANDKIGFISYTGTSAKIKNLTLEGSVTATSNYANVGAFVGTMDGGLLTDCTNKATVNGVMYVGGLVGCVSYDSSNKAKVEKSVNQGAVTGTFSGAGGISGNNYGIVENCYNTGTVTGVDQVGGIIGLANYLTPTNFSTTSCNFNYGTISGSGSTVGNVIGSCSNNPTVESNFYLSATPNKGIGNRDEDTTKTQVLTADEFKDATNFVGFDFLEVWKMGENYPLFAKAYDLWIGNDLVTESRLSGEGWSFAPETNTLTLDGYTLSVDGRAVPDLYKHYAAFTYLGDETLNLVLVGENSITNTIDALNVFAFYSNSPVTISGTGSLYLTTTGSVTNSKALGTKGVLTINGGTVVAQGGPATVFDGTATSTGVSVEGGLVLNGGSLTAIAGESLHYSYGLQCFHGDEYDLVIGEGIKSFVAQGGEIVGDQPSMHKSYSIYANAVSIELDGTGWTDIAGTEGEAAIEAGTYNSNPFGDYLKVEFISGTMITIEIDDKSISYNDDAPTYTYVAKIDGVTVTDTDFLAAIAERVSLGSTYSKGSDADTYAIVNNSLSDARFTYSDANYIISNVPGTLTVNKINAVLTAPTAKADLTYTGEAQAIVNEGSTTGGTIEYKLGDGEWTASVPTATVVDNYTVYYRVVGGTNYNDIAEASIANIAISENDKTALNEAITDAQTYYDSIVTDFADIAADLNGAILDATGVKDEANKTAREISDAVDTLRIVISNAHVEVVKALIDEIDDPVTFASKAGIDTARALYNGLSDDQKPLVSNYNELTDAEAAYADVLANCEATIGNVYYLTLADAYNAVEEGTTITINKDYSISGRGNVLYPYIEVTKDVTLDLDGHTLTIGQLVILVKDGAVLSIKNTKSATGGIKGLAGVDSSSGAYVLIFDSRLVLDAATVKANATSNRIAKGYLVEDINGGEADVNGYYSIVRPITTADVIAAIEAIDDPVVYTDDCKAKIDEARALYDNMDEDDQEDVTNYGTLTDAEAIYAGMDEDAQAFAAYKDTAKGIADDMEEENDSAVCKQFVADAKDAIDALDYDCTKSLAENKALVDAILSALDIALNDHRSAEAVEALIDAIEAPITLEDEEAIEAARSAYNALTENQKDLVGNYDDLLDVEVVYVEELIDAIGDPVTLNDKEAIEKAREVFDELPGTAQDLVENRQDLFDAEAAYKVLDDEAKANAVKELIEAIGEVEYTEDSKEKIDAAKEAYDALTYDQKALIVEDVPTIEAAEATYSVLHSNYLAAAEVIALIEAIGTVEYNEESKGKIDAAKVAYNGLTDAQKAIVDNYLTENEVDTIVVSETIYVGLGNQQRAQEVKDLIVAIGEVKYPDSKDAIEAAREGYDGLTDAQKPLVDNYETLTTAEATYAELEAQANKKLSGGAIAGIVIGCVAFVAIVCFLLWFFLFKKKKEDKDEPKVAVPETNDEPKNDQTDEPKE